uniref:Thyroid peroxidase n=1 Tax=Knipowitschia caucasica TaxID=637954 RepID=A0AAV2JFA5_KNICA
MFTFARQTQTQTLKVTRAAEVFHTTLQVLKSRVRRRYSREAAELLLWEDVALMWDLSQCPPAPLPSECQDPPHEYRSIDGRCNNRLNPLWGAANTALVRWLPAEYEDGEREPKGWNSDRLHNGFLLPSVWEVSKTVLRSSIKPREKEYSQLLVEWGQYIDHDITFTPQTNKMSCLSTCDNVHPCFPIKTGDGCMAFHRSSPACCLHPDLGHTLQLQQMNSITSFLDASVVYGHDADLQASLRGSDGKLSVHHEFRDPRGRPYLPPVPSLPSGCLQDVRHTEGPRVECFLAGDSRVNEGLPLTSLHTLWLREHNRIAQELRTLNAHWSSDTLFQETRKIIGAMHQAPGNISNYLRLHTSLDFLFSSTLICEKKKNHNATLTVIITMRDYIPKIIGPVSYERHIGPYRGYDPDVDPSASNVFATAAFRFGHAAISPTLRRLNQSFQEDERWPHLRLHHTFFSPWRIVKEGGIEPVLRGLIGTAAPAVHADMLVTEELTERLVVLNIPQKMDLAALNLQRGREHGLPGYNKWRQFCGLAPVRTLEDFSEVVGDAIVAKKILDLYKHPNNIDVWLGGLVERFLPGSRTGPLFSCLIAKQMRVLRDGDRFWWEAVGQFAQRQKSELLKTSLSRLICDNSDIAEHGGLQDSDSPKAKSCLASLSRDCGLCFCKHHKRTRTSYRTWRKTYSARNLPETKSTK